MDALSGELSPAQRRERASNLSFGERQALGLAFDPEQAPDPEQASIAADLAIASTLRLRANGVSDQASMERAARKELTENRLDPADPDIWASALDGIEEADANGDCGFVDLPPAPARPSSAPERKRRPEIVRQGRSRGARCGAQRARGSRRRSSRSSSSSEDGPGEPPGIAVPCPAGRAA